MAVGVVFPLVEVLRDRPVTEYSSASTLSEAYLSKENPALSTVSEMGDSMQTISYTLALVPSSRPFDMGAGYLFALLHVFPNFITPLHFELKYGTPDIWLIRVVDPKRANAGGAIGYSFIAEAYLAFGWLGAFVWLSLFGALVAKFFFWASKPPDFTRLAAAGTLLAFLPHVARGTTIELTRPLFWFALVPYLLVLVVFRFNHSESGQSPRQP